MSGAGFYKFRCKNFLTFDCENWVWVNHSACAQCVAAGRDNVDHELQFDTGSSSAPPAAPPCEAISPRRSVATTAGLDFLHLFSEEKMEGTTAAMLESREFSGLDCGENEPRSWETAVKVYPCFQH